MKYISEEDWKKFFQETKNKKSNREKLTERNTDEV